MRGRGPASSACLVSFCRFRAPERPSRERANRMTSQETLDQGISNVETEYLEINSKGAWPILYQVKRSRPVPSLSSSVFCVFPSGSSEKRRFLPANVSRIEPSYITASNFQSGVSLHNFNHHYCSNFFRASESQGTNVNKSIYTTKINLFMT